MVEAEASPSAKKCKKRTSEKSTERPLAKTQHQVSKAILMEETQDTSKAWPIASGSTILSTKESMEIWWRMSSRSSSLLLYPVSNILFRPQFLELCFSSVAWYIFMAIQLRGQKVGTLDFLWQWHPQCFFSFWPSWAAGVWWVKVSLGSWTQWLQKEKQAIHEWKKTKYYYK